MNKKARVGQCIRIEEQSSLTRTLTKKPKAVNSDALAIPCAPCSDVDLIDRGWSTFPNRARQQRLRKRWFR